MELTVFFDKLWEQNQRLCPEVASIDALLKAHGEKKILNDHVAFRTLSGPDSGLARLIPLFESMGYCRKDRYRFETKKLNAEHLEHPNQDNPKIFISELSLAELPEEVGTLLTPAIRHIATHTPLDSSLFYSGRHWPLNWPDYDRLIKHSEYAAWFYAFGYVANHFTVSINDLESFTNIEAVNDYLEHNNITLNTSNGKIKGSEQLLLKQSATLAFDTAVTGLENGIETVRKIPGVFREMAQRFALPSGKLFQGFVEGNADSIFESTDTRNR